LLFFEDFQQEEASGVLLSSQAKDNQNSFGSPLVLQAWKNPQKICKIGLRRTTILLLWTCSTILFAHSASILWFSLLTNCMNSLILSAH
jgi:hypothetical protein